MNHNIKELMNTVVDNDYCIGCGICASLTSSPIKMEMDEYGKYKPFLKGSIDEVEMGVNVLTVCPFTNHSKNENEIGKELFEELPNSNFNKYTGFFIKN